MDAAVRYRTVAANRLINEESAALTFHRGNFGQHLLDDFVHPNTLSLTYIPLTSI